MKARHELLNSAFERAIFLKAREGVLPEFLASPKRRSCLAGMPPRFWDPLARVKVGRPLVVGSEAPVLGLHNHGEVERGIDADGRRHGVDEYDHKRSTAGTIRPLGFLVHEWKRFSVKQRVRAILGVS